MKIWTVFNSSTINILALFDLERTIGIAHFTREGHLEASKTSPESVNTNPTHIMWSVGHLHNFVVVD
jgi:hypothetical protein